MSHPLPPPFYGDADNLTEHQKHLKALTDEARRGIALAVLTFASNKHREGEHIADIQNALGNAMFQELSHTMAMGAVANGTDPELVKKLTMDSFEVQFAMDLEQCQISYAAFIGESPAKPH